jgi:hydroxymethylpyrimidine kinase/phosphomethylpyrimidine kinase
MAERRVPAPVEKPVVLTIAGSDSGGGAGIQADLKTIEAMGGFGTSAVTAVTAQNTTGVESSHVLPIDEIDAQIDAVRSDFEVRGVKTGMLATAAVVETVTSAVSDLEAPLVVDPVMVAATGDRLLTETAESAYEALIAEAALVTPNADEAAVLTGIKPDDEESARRAGQTLLEMGADAALIKGGHMPGETVLDVLVTPKTVETATHPRIDTDATHGSGCTLSAAIATRLARGASMAEATENSVAFMERAVRYHHDAGTKAGAVHHLVELRNEAARGPTVDTLKRSIDRLCEMDIGRFIPEGGMNVAATTPYAEGIEETATIDGKIRETADGIETEGCIRFGVPSDLARRLLEAREHRPDLSAALECRPDNDLKEAIETLEWPLVGDDGEPTDESAMSRLTDSEAADGIVVVDHGETATVLGPAPEPLVGGLSQLIGEL